MSIRARLELKSKLEVLCRNDLCRVHEASLKILSETGVIFNNEDALRILKSHGAKVDGAHAILPQALVEKALATCPSVFRMTARNEANSISIGDGFVVQPNVGPVFVQELHHGRRPGTLQDFANFQKMAQSSEVVHMAGATPVAPSDVPPSERALRMLYTAIKHSDKPLVGSCTSARKARQSLQLVERSLGGKTSLEESYLVAVSVNPFSPMAFGGEVLETILEYARRNQPIFVLPCILSGVTGPMSLLGTVVQQNAEILAGVTLIQCIREGTPTVYAPASTAAWMRTGSYVTGPPEAFLINTANLQLALDLYHLPTRIMHGMTDAKEVDCQAGYETMQNMMMGMLSGGHILEECLGVLDSIMTTSYEKWIIDEELLSRVMRICKGLAFSDEAMALQAIQDTCPGGSYIMHEHTLEHMKDNWEPTVSNWDSYYVWCEKGAPHLVQKANQIWRGILAEAPDTMIDQELDKDLIGFMEESRNGD